MQSLAKFISVQPTQILADLVVIEGIDIVEHPTFTRAPFKTVPETNDEK